MNYIVLLLWAAVMLLFASLAVWLIYLVKKEG